MGTRAVIARRTGKDTFAGRYHHWDGYPSGLGAQLFEVCREHFNGDLKAMMAYLIDDHPAGWSTINDRDFTQPPGFAENGFKSGGPACYCHGGRSEGENLITELNASDCGCEWAYVFDTKTKKMLVLASVWKKGGKKMIGFGCGGKASDVVWKKVATVDLTISEQPDWEHMNATEGA